MKARSIASPFVGMAAAVLVVFGVIVPAIEYLTGTPADSVGMRSIDREAEMQLSRSWDALERCYDASGTTTASRNSAIVLRLRIDKAGTVTDVDVLQAPPRSELLTRCVQTEVRTWHFSDAAEARSTVLHVDPVQHSYTGT